MDLAGVCPTVDALHSLVDLNQRVLARGGHVIFVIKGNQPHSRQLLHVVAPFRVYVSTQVLARLLDDDEPALLARARNLAYLGLLEANEDSAGAIMFRVPLVLETRLRDESPDAHRRLQANCAAALAADLPDIVHVPDPRRLDQALLQEVNRLAIAGNTRDLAVDTAVALASSESFYYRFEKAARICRHMLDLYPDHRLYWAAAMQELHLGRSQAAELFLDQAADSCPPDAARVRAMTLAGQAYYIAQRNPPHAEELLREAERLARGCGEDEALNDALTQLAMVYASIGGTRSRAAAEPLFEEALTVAERIADSGIRVAHVLRWRADAYLGWGDPDRAMLDIEAAMHIYDREGLSLHQAMALFVVAAAFIARNAFDEARVALDRCETIVHSLAWAYGEAMCAGMRAGLAVVQGRDTESEILLDYALTGRVAELVEVFSQVK